MRDVEIHVTSLVEAHLAEDCPADYVPGGELNDREKNGTGLNVTGQVLTCGCLRQNCIIEEI